MKEPRVVVKSFAEQCAVFGSGGIGRIVRLRRDYRFFRFHIRSFHFGTSSKSEAACSDSNQEIVRSFHVD